MPAAAADERFMALALHEARKGLGRTAPNPAVGAVVVKNGKVIAAGHHSKAGGPHAEVVALKRAGRKARGATLYSTLEPCCHQGRTPPCTEAIRAAGISRVVFATRDPNPLVNGKGLRRLREARIKVAEGAQRDAALELNRAWFHFMEHGVPYISLKIASTADGKLATADGDSRWITSAKARTQVHHLRNEVDAILVGSETVRADNPELSARIPGGHAPLRVVLDGSLMSPADAKVYRPGHLVFTRVSPASTDRRTIQRLPSRRGHISLLRVLRELGRRGVVHLLVEGGARTFTEFIEHDLWDELFLYVAPKLAGPDGRPWFVGQAASRMKDAMALGAFTASSVGPDAVLRIVRHPVWSL